MTGYFAGLDIGGSSIKFGVIDKGGNIAWQAREKTPFGDLEGLISIITEMVSEAQMHYSFNTLGIGCPGYADTEQGIVREAANLGLAEIRFRNILDKKLGLKVKIQNDVEAAMLAESKYGACKDKDHVVYVALGTGVGGGFILNGKPYRGHKNQGAEIGHMVTHKDGRQCVCGMQGCFEQYASVNALIKCVKDAYKEKGLADEAEIVGGRYIFDKLRRGDSLVSKAYDTWLGELCTGLISLMALFAPQLIVIGGGLSNEGVFFENTILKALNEQEAYNRYYKDIEVKAALMGNNAGIIGAASLHLLD